MATYGTDKASRAKDQQESTARQGMWARRRMEDADFGQITVSFEDRLRKRVEELKAVGKLPPVQIDLRLFSRYNNYPTIDFRLPHTSVNLNADDVCNYLLKQCSGILEEFKTLWISFWRQRHDEDHQLEMSRLSSAVCTVTATLLQPPPEDNLKALGWARRLKKKGHYWEIPDDTPTNL